MLILLSYLFIVFELSNWKYFYFRYYYTCWIKLSWDSYLWRLLCWWVQNKMFFALYQGEFILYACVFLSDLELYMLMNDDWFSDAVENDFILICCFKHNYVVISRILINFILCLHSKYRSISAKFIWWTKLSRK